MATATRKTAAAKAAPAQPAPEGDQEGTLGANQGAPATEPQPTAPGPATGVLDGLQRLRAPFEPEAIGKLPRGTCKACRDVARQYRACDSHTFVRRCAECGGSHSSATMHLDYVGHADLTDRLLDVDPFWTWEPFSQEQIMALPPAMREGGLWINLTVLGVTRPGFGDAAGKTGGDAVKEAIGDALRNAGMRFGAALYLWAKGDRSWAKAEDETPEDLVKDQQASAAVQGTGRQDGTTGSTHHARVEQIDAMTRAEIAALPKHAEAELKRYDTHWGAWNETWANLDPAVQEEVKRTWPADVPTPSQAGGMSIRQIDASRAEMRRLADLHAAHLANGGDQNPPA
jgi:hypothetical protein